MEFVILKENLLKALSIVGKSISLRPQLPILSQILIQTEDNKLKFSSTNLELGTVFTTLAKIEKEGETTIPGKLFYEFANSIIADKVKLISDDKKVTVEAGKTRASFTTMPVADFPPFPKLPEEKKPLPYEKLKEAIPRAVFAASIDESRPVLTGVKIEVNNQKVTLAATDGYRLSLEEIELTDKIMDMRVVIPAQSLSEVVRIAQEIKAKEVSLTLIPNKNQVAFILPNTFIFTRLIDGDFPNIEKIIPVSFKTKVVVDKESFLRSVKVASLFARGAANIVKVKIENSGLRLSANSPQVGEDEDFVEAKVQGEEVEVAFNYRFLLDVLNNFPDEEIVFETTGSVNPGVFKPAESKVTYLHIIMPVRVQG